jgi:hypothetical protein
LAREECLMRPLTLQVAMIVLVAGVPLCAEEPRPGSAKEALQKFNSLIGTWKGTGQPEGTREQKQKGFWTEGIQWEWQFRSNAVWLAVVFDKGKHFTKGELRYQPAEDVYQLKLITPAKEELVFAGKLDEHRLVVERTDAATKETQRLVLTLLHDNRFLYRYEVRAEGKPTFSRRYQVGATKEGVAFAGPATNGPECIVSGGLGTIAVTYKGKTYYVCCTGCRDAFRDEPEKYIKEYEEKKTKGGK